MAEPKRSLQTKFPTSKPVVPSFRLHLRLFQRANSQQIITRSLNESLFDNRDHGCIAVSLGDNYLTTLLEGDLAKQILLYFKSDSIINYTFGLCQHCKIW